MILGSRERASMPDSPELFSAMRRALRGNQGIPGEPPTPAPRESSDGCDPVRGFSGRVVRGRAGKWFHWPRAGYFPIAAGMVGVGKLLGTYVAQRVERNTNSG
jgi:hypothetical protein